MPGLNTWFERFVNEDRMPVMLFCREPMDDRAGSGAWSGIRAAAHGEDCLVLDELICKKTVNGI